MAAAAPPFANAASIFALPPVESGTHRSRGMESMVTCFVAGSHLPRVIDWGNGYLFFPSSSEPRSNTVKGAPGAADGVGVAATPGLRLGGTLAVWPVWPTPATTTGKK